MKTFEEIEAELINQKDGNLSEIEKFKNNKEKAERALKIANDELIKAEETADLVAYDKAKGDIWTSQHAIELYQKQLDKLESTPLVTKDDYNQLVSDIEKAADKLQDELNIKGAKLMAELKSLADESNAVYHKADELLRIAQYDVYKDADCLVASNGTRITRAVEYKRADTVRSVYSFKYLGNTFLDDMNAQ
ncbi:hypothetical protein LLUC047_11150 [Lactococcus cremoris]|uniref:Prophage ps3 protein 07 n=3 Tax=Bacilli TaxID=91061 RepID=T0WMP3_LACLC|nr:hypothetical protein [Lactococcus cremoris]EQC93933.1 hypothetical protein LLT3_06315 [Lactococcus cremoris subsp. cremoris TIFN3]QSD63872.1 hypothetical protein LL1196_2263 [Lactococcus cremoris]UXV63114.1 hypothetical protein LLUC047_11150 [Lactococcus cremoris]